MKLCAHKLSAGVVEECRQGASTREVSDMQGTWSCGTVFSRVAHLVPCGRWLCLDDEFDEARAPHSKPCVLQALADLLLARPCACDQFSCYGVGQAPTGGGYAPNTVLL